jgi:chorismate synthase
MTRLRFLTAGESHGQAVTAIIDGMPAGLAICEEEIELQLQRRQRGYGRGGRMTIERDRARILSGVRYGKTMGSPIALLVENRDWPNWQEKMAVREVEQPSKPLRMPRPGHADFAGMVKYRQDDLRNILERSSARETTMRVAVSAIARKLLTLFDIEIWGHVIALGGIKSGLRPGDYPRRQFLADREHWLEFFGRVENSPLACADEETTRDMMRLIDEKKELGDTLGGVFELIATGLPIGLGSHSQWDLRLGSLIAQGMLSIPALKGVELGTGMSSADLRGSEMHDAIYKDEAGIFRTSNNAGGIEGGMSNGEPVWLHAAMKPLPTLRQPLPSIDLETGQAAAAFSERSDVCAVAAATVVGEAMLALTLSDSLLLKLGGDSVTELQEHYKRLTYVPLGW